MSQVRYATVRKYSSRVLSSSEFRHAVFGVKIFENNHVRTILARTPEEIVYFLDDSSYQSFLDKLLREHKNILKVCSTHKN